MIDYTVFYPSADNKQFELCLSHHGDNYYVRIETLLRKYSVIPLTKQIFIDYANFMNSDIIEEANTRNRQFSRYHGQVNIKFSPHKFDAMEFRAEYKDYAIEFFDFTEMRLTAAIFDEIDTELWHKFNLF